MLLYRDLMADGITGSGQLAILDSKRYFNTNDVLDFLNIYECTGCLQGFMLDNNRCLRKILFKIYYGYFYEF